jgi:hypothetical protein
MIDYTLSLTSPLTEGEDVGRAQTILNGNNVFKNDWHRGRIDHVFGPETGRSCIRAKFWIGYKEEDLKPTYGPALDSYLLGEAPLTAEMTRRIKKRMDAAEATPLRLKALAEAKRHIGDKERTGHNDIWVTDWYGLRGPWCAMYVTYCYDKVGSKAFAKPPAPPSSLHPGSGTYAYVPFMVSDARFGRNGLQVVSSPQPGDIVCYDWDGGVADHTGLFEKWRDRSRGKFIAVEGNTAVGNDSNGGEVMERSRHFSQVETFVRVGR